MRKLVKSTNEYREYDHGFRFDPNKENKDFVNILKLFIDTNNEKKCKYYFDWVCCIYIIT